MISFEELPTRAQHAIAERLDPESLNALASTSRTCLELFARDAYFVASYLSKREGDEDALCCALRRYRVDQPPSRGLQVDELADVVQVQMRWHHEPATNTCYDYIVRGWNRWHPSSFSEALCIASERGFERVVRLLLDELEIRGGSDTTLREALLSATIHGRCGVVVALLEKSGADAASNLLCSQNYPDDDSPLVTACIHGHVEVVHALLRAGADVLERECEPLHVSSERGFDDVVRLLLSTEALKKESSAIGKGKNEALMLACVNGHVETARALMDDGIRDSAGKIYGTRWLPSAIRALFSSDAKNAQMQRAELLKSASAAGKTSIVRYLVEEVGLDVHALDDAAITESVKNGHAQTLLYLIKKGRGLYKKDKKNKKNKDGGRKAEAVSIATKNGHVEVLRVLAKEGRADVCAQDGFALIWAAQEGSKNIVRTLLASGPQNETRWGSAITVSLKLAASKQHADVIEVIEDFLHEWHRMRDRKRIERMRIVVDSVQMFIILWCIINICM